MAKRNDFRVSQPQRVVVQEQGPVGGHRFAETLHARCAKGPSQGVDPSVQPKIDLIAKLDQKGRVSGGKEAGWIVLHLVTST
jgi:hypothetical protein